MFSMIIVYKIVSPVSGPFPSLIASIEMESTLVTLNSGFGAKLMIVSSSSSFPSPGIPSSLTSSTTSPSEFFAVTVTVLISLPDSSSTAVMV